MTEIVVHKEQADFTAGTKVDKPWWQHDGAPEGSHEFSLYERDDNGNKRVAPATHYHHLADGRIIPGYSQGTHYTEPDGNGGDRVTRIVAVHAG